MAETTASHDPTRRRRAPAPDERQRDPERSRRRILDAARQVFGAKGYAGARVTEIAERAGVNHQLISYYFGGKEGLYDELLAQWHQREAEMAGAEIGLDDLVVAYLAATHDQPDMARLLVWDGLTAPTRRTAGAGGASGAAGGDQPTDDDGGEPPEVADLRRRQAEGELAGDVEPGFLMLALMAAVAAGITMPDMAARLTGIDPQTPQFVERYGETLRRLVRALGRPLPDG